jgi:hypothetical protein
MGRTKPVRANLDALFALPSAAITLQTAAGLNPSGAAGVCWKPPAGQSVTEVQKEIAELLAMPDDPATGAAVPGPGTVTQSEDAYGFRWLLLDDPDLDRLVTRVHLVNTSLTENGWGPQLLCSVFGFVPAADADVAPESPPDALPDGGFGIGAEAGSSGADRTGSLFLVYLYKRGTFYPFAPDGKEHRNSELELRTRAVLGSDLPVEQDLQRWFPLWDLPVR